MMDGLEFTGMIIIANVPPNDPNVDALAIVLAPVIPDHAPAQPVGAVGLIRWIEKTEMVFIVSKCIEANKVVFAAATFQDQALTWWNSQVATLGMEVVTRKTWEEMKVMITEEFFPPEEIQRMEVILCPGMVPTERKKVEAYIRGLSENIKGEVTSSEPVTLNKVVRIAHTLIEQKVKAIAEREADNKKRKIDTEGRIKKKFKEQDRHFLGLGCDSIKTDRKVRKVMSDLSGVKKLVKGLSDRFDEYKRSKVFYAKRVLEKELVNERNAKEFYREFVREPPAEPSARPVSTPYPDDPYVVTRDAAIADAAIATSSIDNDDDDTAPIDSQPHELRGSLRDTQIIVFYEYSSHSLNYTNRMIQESVEAAIRAERERVQNEANRAEGPNVAPVVRECTFTDFMKCSPITFCGNEGAVGLIRLIEKTEMVFTVATLGIEVVTRKTWAEIKVMMTKEFFPPEEIQMMESELWNLRVKEMDISSYTTRFNELAILCPEMVPTERKKVEAYIRGLSKNIKGEVTSSEPSTLSKAVRMAHTLMKQNVKAKAEREADNKKRKWENFQGGSSTGGGNNNSNRNNNNYNSNRNYNNNNQNQYRNPNRNHQNNQRQGNARAMTNVRNQNTNDAGQNVTFNRCGMQHYGNCSIKFNKCGKIEHKARDCWSKVVATSANAQPIVTCY
nr:hypothetical protein [Tanacetum cinerariifolium]